MEPFREDCYRRTDAQRWMFCAVAAGALLLWM
jgi:hypothetical protein